MQILESLSFHKDLQIYYHLQTSYTNDVIDVFLRRTTNKMVSKLFSTKWERLIFLPVMVLFHIISRSTDFKRAKKDALPNDVYPQRNFREFFFEHFAGINVRESGFNEDFAGINFRESTLFKGLARVNLAFALRNIFPRT